MSLDCVLLGMLKDPASGYDLKKQFEQGAKFFWSAEFGQIYATLKRMVDQGWLKCKSAPADKGPPRKIYRRTPAGTAVLRKWLTSGPVFGTERYPYVAQMIFLGQLNEPEQTLCFVLQLREEISGALAILKESADRHRQQLEESPESCEVTHALLAVELGIATLKAKIKWCESTTRQLKSIKGKRS